jgi:hypothetical protein
LYELIVGGVIANDGDPTLASHVDAATRREDERVGRSRSRRVAAHSGARVGDAHRLRAAHRFLLDAGDADSDLGMADALYEYGFMRMRPEVLGWGEEAGALGRAIGHPLTPAALATAGLGAWIRGDLVTMHRLGQKALDVTDELGLPLGLTTANLIGVHAMATGRLDEAQEWLARSLETHDADAKTGAAARVLHRSCAVCDLLRVPRQVRFVPELLASIPDSPTPHGAYAWYGAAEAIMNEDPLEARRRARRALDEAEVTGAWFVTGIAGASVASIDARHGEVDAAAAAAYRWLLPWWRRSGEYSALWTLLPSIAQPLDRLGRPRTAAVLLGAVTAPGSGHEVFGDDALRLADLATRLEGPLGDDFADARAEGAGLDVEAAAALAASELES